MFFNGFLTTVLVSVVLLLIFTVFNPIKSFQILRVMSGSMEPEIKTGSVVFVQKIKPETLKKDDIITYTSLEDPDILITHRLTAIEEKEEKTIFKTQGDANNSEDMGEISSSQIKGKVVFSLPLLGYLSVWIREPKGFGLLVVLPAILIILSEILNIKKAIEEEVEKKYKNKKIKKGIKIKNILFFLFLSPALVGLRACPTNAYFSHTLVSNGNTFTAGWWADTEAPTSEITSIQDYSTSQTFDINYDSFDDTDFVQLCYSFNYDDWVCDPAYIDHPHSAGSFSFDSPHGDGVYDFYTLATDHAGNVEDDTGKAGSPYSVQVDSLPPTTNIDLDSLPLNQWDGQNLLTNGDFETGINGWTIDVGASGDHQIVTSATDWYGDLIDPVSGAQMLQIGFEHSPLWENALDAVYQIVHIPAKLSANLSFNYRFLTDDTADYDQFSAKIISWTGNLLENILITGDTSFSPGWYDSDWQHISHPLLNYAGQTIKLWFGVSNKDLVGDPRNSWAFIDDIKVSTLDTRVGETSVISFDAHDVGSGLDETPFDVDSQVGENQLDFYSTDMVGNIENTHSSDIVVLPPVVLNKIYPAPSLGDEKIELFNNTSDDIDLDSWSICDNASTPHCHSLSGNIGAGSTLAFSQNFFLNNATEDTAYLKESANIIDEFTYPGRSDHDWYWQRSPDGIGTWELVVADMDFNLISRSSVNKATLSVFNIPSIYGQIGTDNLEYEIIYNSVGIPKGIAGYINPNTIIDGNIDYDFYLGTCTTGGVCTPDAGIGSTITVIISGSIDSTIVTSTKTFDY